MILITVSAFHIVRFNNEGCIGTDSRNGTCYTAEECGSKSGFNMGSCAAGYGICCLCKCFIKAFK